MSAKRRLLLICPQFFNYHEAILDAARRMAIAAEWIEDRGGSGLAFKVALKVLPDTTRRLTQGRVRELIDHLHEPGTIDDILIVKGDGLSASTLKLLQMRAPNARTTLYLWDSAANIPGIHAVARLSDRVLTFDPSDAVRFEWGFLPLFSRDEAVPPGEPGVPAYDWSFVGSLHSDRHRVLRRLVQYHPALKCRMHCYAQSRLASFVRSYRDPAAILPSAIPVTTKLLTADEARDITRTSRAVVDIEHPAQVGLTMRTIETLVGGRKLITTNANLRAYDIYDPSRVAIIDRRRPRISPDFFSVPFAPIPESIARSYHVVSWLERALAHGPPGESPIRPLGAST